MTVSKDRIMRAALELLGPAPTELGFHRFLFWRHLSFPPRFCRFLAFPGFLVQEKSCNPQEPYLEPIRRYVNTACFFLPFHPCENCDSMEQSTTYTREETDRGQFRAATRDLQGTLPSRIVSPCAVNSRHLRVDRARFPQRGCTLLGVC